VSRTLPLVLLLLSPGSAWAEPAPAEPTDPVLRAAVLEVERIVSEGSAQDPPPYFLAVEITDTESVQITAEEGALQGYAPKRSRWVDVDVRVGSSRLDSTHPLRSGQDRRRRHGRALVLSDDEDVLRRGIWREVDGRFVEAQERWAKVESDAQVLVEEEPAEDLSATDPVVDVGPVASLDLDLARWEQTVKLASALLADSRVVHDGSVKLSAEAVTRRFVSSEGTRVRHGRAYLRLNVHLDTLADDGEELSVSQSWDAATAAGLPSDEEILGRVRELEDLLERLREAPLQDPYTGPAILSGRASAVFFHEILGHRLEGHRLKRVDDAQTFRDMVGQPILPDFLSVIDDPGLRHAAGEDLRGHYTFDNQGEPAARVVLVDGGVLTDFLQSRSPVRQGQRSNGHGRRQKGQDAVSRQGNLLIEATRTVDEAALRRALLERVEEAGLEYGLRIDEISGGFTLTGRKMPNAFDVKVVVGHRIYVDGRPDELIRGVDLIGTPLVTFGRIEAAGARPQVFNGSCGAESGWVPVSAVAPALLVGEVETQRKAKGQQTPPLLPPPAGEEVER